MKQREIERLRKTVSLGRERGKNERYKHRSIKKEEKRNTSD